MKIEVPRYLAFLFALWFIMNAVATYPKFVESVNMLIHDVMGPSYPVIDGLVNRLGLNDGELKCP
jgi:hypothetical protein